MAGIVLGLGLLVLSVAIASYVRQKYHENLSRERAQKETTMKELHSATKDNEMLTRGWRLDWSSVDLQGSEIARGSYGRVWCGYLNGSIKVAVKEMFDSSYMDIADDDEISFLQRARHPRLVLFMGCGKIPSTNNTFLVLEWMGGGDLSGVLHKSERAQTLPPTWAIRVRLLADVAEGMAFLHDELHSIHRDLKCDNCLLGESQDGTLRAKVADFGLSRFDSTVNRAAIDDVSVSSKTTRRRPDSVSAEMTCLVGTLVYMAPEVMSRRRSKTGTGYRAEYSNRIDVYSFGMILYEALALTRPWAEVQTNFSSRLMEIVESGRRPTFTEEARVTAPDGYVSLMQACWDGSGEKRPPFQDVVKRLRRMMGATPAPSRSSVADVTTTTSTMQGMMSSSGTGRNLSSSGGTTETFEIDVRSE